MYVARADDLRGVGIGKIRTDLFPILASKRGFQQNVGCVVDDLAVVWRYEDRCIPVPPQVLAVIADAPPFTGALVEPAQRAELTFVVQPTGIGGIHHVVHAVAATDSFPVLENYPATQAGAGPLHGAVVLQAAVHIVREIHVEADRVELGQWNVVGVIPILAAVVGNAHAVVVTQQHVLGVLRIDP